MSEIEKKFDALPLLATRLNPIVGDDLFGDLAFDFTGVFDFDLFHGEIVRAVLLRSFAIANVSHYVLG